MRELGKRIHSRRVRLGLTLVDVATAVGRSHSWLTALEKGDGNPPSEVLTALAIKLGEDPKEYLRLAGRVSLTAADVTPLTRPELPPGFADAVSAAVAAQLQPLLDRIDALLARLPIPPDGPADQIRRAVADVEAARQEMAEQRTQTTSQPPPPSRGRRARGRRSGSREAGAS